MPRPLPITQRQATALMKAAKEVGCAVEFDPSTGVVRIIPAIPKNYPQPNVPLDKGRQGYL